MIKEFKKFIARGNVMDLAVGVIMGGALILSKSKNSVSPFVFMSTLILFAVFGSLIDPAKWICTISLIVSFTLFIVSSAVYERIHQQKD